MKPWTGLADLIEDTRHATMQLRRWLTPEDLRGMRTTPRVLVDASNRAAKDLQETTDAADKAELELANFLMGQYEEALVVLGSRDLL